MIILDIPKRIVYVIKRVVHSHQLNKKSCEHEDDARILGFTQHKEEPARPDKNLCSHPLTSSLHTAPPFPASSADALIFNVSPVWMREANIS